MDPTLLRNLILLVRVGILAICLLAIYLAFYYLLPYLGVVLSALPNYFLPFILALILAVLIEPLVKKMMQGSRLKRGGAVLISLLLIWGITLIIFTLIITRLVMELIQVYRYLSLHSGQISQNLAQTIDRLQQLYLNLNIPIQVQEGAQQNLGALVEGIRQLVQVSLNALMEWLSMFPNLLAVFLIATIATFFISRDKALLINALAEWLPVEMVRKLSLVLKNLGAALLGFIKAQTILVSVTAIIAVTGLYVLGMEYALTIGLISGLLDILPVVGPGLLMLPWAFWLLASGSTATGCGLLVLYGIMALIRQFLEPKILSEKIGLHPLATLMGMYVGLKLGGVAGMILGPIFLVVIQALHRAGLLSFGPLRPNR